jgi:hypothetical protein
MTKKHYALLNSGCGFAAALVWWVPFMFLAMGGPKGEDLVWMLIFFFGGYILLFLGVLSNWIFVAVDSTSRMAKVWKVLSFASVPVYILVVLGILSSLVKYPGHYLFGESFKELPVPRPY